MKKMVVWGMLAALMLGVSGAVAQPVMATDPPESGEEAEGPETNNSSLGASDLCNDDRIDDALKKAAGCKDTQRADELANTIINVALTMVGILAVGVMIYGGYTYLISNGNLQKAEKAKHIIMYGLIGLVVCLLAYAIVVFVGKSIPS